MKLDVYKCPSCLYTTFCEAGQTHLFFLDDCPKCGTRLKREKPGESIIKFIKGA